MNRTENAFQVLSIDAWRDGPGWTWNQWFDVGTIPNLPTSTRKLLRLMRDCGFLSEKSRGRVEVEDDGYNVVILDRGTREPIFAVVYGDREDA